MRFNVLTAEFLPDWVKVIPTGPTHPCDQTDTLSPPLAGATGGAAGAPGTPHQQRRRALRHLRKEPLASAQPRRRADETPRDRRGGSASSASALRRGAAPGAEAHPQGEGAAPQEQETPLAEEGGPQRLALTCGLGRPSSGASRRLPGWPRPLPTPQLAPGQPPWPTENGGERPRMRQTTTSSARLPNKNANSFMNDALVMDAAPKASLWHRQRLHLGDALISELRVVGIRPAA